MIIRRAEVKDGGQMAALLNRIIAIGGTTAHEVAKSAATVRRDYIDGPDCITSVVAEEGDTILGWQAIGWWQGDAHIGSFVDPETHAKGIGAAMFAMTVDLARQAGLADIHASIRADNVPGLAYYARIGFTDASSDPGFALSDGRVVGRVNRIYQL
ncbi:GNAT family N-acetyltransferase [Thioclava sp. FR2]|uniref:GNAT family N-acetyltransferase n=1 Tax=Thioclava sp. FR2 TaxID=3445780 RepID=UPI003EC09AAB